MPEEKNEESAEAQRAADEFLRALDATNARIDEQEAKGKLEAAFVAGQRAVADANSRVADHPTRSDAARATDAVLECVRAACALEELARTCDPCLDERQGIAGEYAAVVAGERHDAERLLADRQAAALGRCRSAENGSRDAPACA